MSVCAGRGWGEFQRFGRARVPGGVGGRKRGGSVWKASSRGSAYVGVGAHVCVLLLLWSLAC